MSLGLSDALGRLGIGGRDAAPDGPSSQPQVSLSYLKSLVATIIKSSPRILQHALKTKMQETSLAPH